MWAVATTDLVLAALTTDDTFPGGFTTRVGGHTFLLMGTLATLLLVPIVVTANRPAQRWLGRQWKWIQRLTYIVWLVILAHLFLLFDFTSFFIDALALSVPLVIIRLPFVSRRWVTARRAGRHRALRGAATVALVAVFLAGFTPFVQELAVKGSAAFVQQPVDD
jgi:DMSO/TMAO reductase YedYZ heme-binding membrane subunit